jgi:ABC-type lipoprotein release transport system permease subunit
MKSILGLRSLKGSKFNRGKAITDELYMLNKENRYLFHFAWKSIQRNAGRSFFIGLSVSIAVFIAVWVVAFFDGLNHQIEKAVVNTNTGFYQLQEPNYSHSTDSSTPLDFAPFASEFNGPLIKSFSPELVLDGNISTPEGAAGLAILGIEPSLHKKFLPIYKKIKSGKFLQESDADSIVIGRELADVFKFKIDDQLVLNYQDFNGELRSELLKIKGIYHFSSKLFEKRFVYINQRTWQKLFFNEERGKVLFNRISLMTDDLKNYPLIKDKLKNSGLTLKTWKNLNPEMAVVLEFHDGMINFFLIIIAITVTMTILTPVQMLWQERLKELRMLNVLGVSNKKFWKIGLSELVIMIICSGIGSSLFLTIIIGIQSQTGIDFRFLNDGVSIERAGIKLPGVIYPQLSLEQILTTFIFVIFVLGLSYLWSIHRTLKKLTVAP